MVITRQSMRLRLVGGGAFWIVAAVVYLALEAAAAAAFLPGYSYADYYISDLGITVRGTFSGRLIDSPRAQVMNAAFYIQGALFLGGAVLRGRRAGQPGCTERVQCWQSWAATPQCSPDPG